jgi:hypothetical protein
MAPIPIDCPIKSAGSRFLFGELVEVEIEFKDVDAGLAEQA